MIDAPQTKCAATAPLNSTRRERQRPPRTQVLVVLHSDGYVQLFAPEQIDAHIAVMPSMNRPEGERLAEDYLAITLPRRFRQVYLPGNIRATGLVETIRPSDIAHRQLMQKMLSAIDSLTSTDEEEVSWTC